MSTLSKSALVQEFLTDHREFMQLLRDVGIALDDGDVQRARALGAELDEIAGPHIAFEEAVLYPALDKRTHDRSFVEKLYDEHQHIVQALSQLLTEPDLDPGTLKSITEAFATGLEHAEHCGTLISRLSALNETDQKDALDELRQLRLSGLSWTTLMKGV